MLCMSWAVTQVMLLKSVGVEGYIGLWGTRAHDYLAVTGTPSVYCMAWLCSEVVHLRVVAMLHCMFRRYCGAEIDRQQ
jgi:hypothetical protein